MDICSKWGAPEFVRCDNGTELVNHLTSALYDAFGVRVLRGTVRHPQSQGAVERFNRTLLTLIRKTESQCDDWLSALNMMLFACRNRPQSVMGVSPMEAICGWSPRGLVVDKPRDFLSSSAWVDKLRQHSAAV